MRSPVPVGPCASRTLDELSSWCKACHGEATRKWRTANRDKINARRRQREVEQGAKARTEAGRAMREMLKA